MGCCISAGDRRSPVEVPPGSPEETVKEVLMETVPVAVDGERGIVKGMAGEHLDHTMVEDGSTAEIVLENGNEEIIVSEASEIYSYGDSNFSNAAAEREEKEDEDGVVDQRPPARKRRAVSSGRGRGRRGVTAAEKRGQVAPLRPVRGRIAAGQPRTAAQLENGRPREAGEGSSRRSRSPVRLGEEFPRREMGEEKGVEKEVVLGEEKRPANDVVSAEEAESLENPIVSLECFIFL